jgi:hypothetical protein
LKKCAFELGLAQDVVNPDSYKQVEIVAPEVYRVEKLIKESNSIDELELFEDNAKEYGLTAIYEAIKTKLL